MFRSKLLFVFFFSLLGLGRGHFQELWQEICYAQQQDSDLQWALAEHLSGKGEHYRAITEYERFMFYFPEDKRARLARLKVLESYVAGKWWPEGLRAAREALEEPGFPQELRCRVLELAGICHMRMGDAPKGLETFRSALEICADPAARDRIRLLMAELQSGLGHWAQAAQSLETFETTGKAGLVARQQAARVTRGEVSSQGRSPWTAGILAGLLPGAGHAYLGRWEDAALVFLVNGVFLGATLEAVEKRQPALAGGMALAELIWYSGNIFSAVSNAHKHNKGLAEQWIKDIGWELDLAGQGP